MSRRIKFKLQDTVPPRVIFLDPSATEGATLGTDVLTPNGVVGTPKTVREWLNVTESQNPRERPPSSGVSQHRLLQGLTLGDDHPQYTQWVQDETITGAWTYQRVVTFDRQDFTTWASLFFTDSSNDPTDGTPARISHDDFGSVHIVTNANYAGSANNFTRDDDTFPAFMISLNQEFDEIVWHVAAAGAGTINWNAAGAALRMGVNGNLRITSLGTALLPALVIGGDTDTGLYQTAGDMLGFSTAGVARLTIQAAGVDGGVPFRQQSGSAAAPTYTFWTSSDINTGMYRVAEDTIGFSAGGVRVLSAELSGTNRLVQLGDGTNAAILDMDGAAASARVTRFKTGGVLRWDTRANTTAEGGANAGSDYDINRYDDAGTLLGSALRIVRSSGYVLLANDNQRLQIGLGLDLQFYHDGTDSKINNVTGRLDITSAGTITVDKPLRLKGYTVATLPAGTQGDTAFVTDALAPTFLAAVVGGGTVVTPVFYDGTNWTAY